MGQQRQVIHEGDGAVAIDVSALTVVVHQHRLTGVLYLGKDADIVGNVYIAVVVYIAQQADLHILSNSGVANGQSILTGNMVGFHDLYGVVACGNAVNAPGAGFGSAVAYEAVSSLGLAFQDQLNGNRLGNLAGGYELAGNGNTGYVLRIGSAADGTYAVFEAVTLGFYGLLSNGDLTADAAVLTLGLTGSGTGRSNSGIGNQGMDQAGSEDLGGLRRMKLRPLRVTAALLNNSRKRE